MLEVRNLACERGEARLFSEMSFSLSARDLLLVQGPNGSGKTTLLRTLAGLSRAAAGAVLWCGEDTRKLREAYASQMVFVGHSNAVKDEFSAEENLAMSLELAGCASTPAQRAAALEGVGLASRARLPARYLSQGQKRRVALARLFLAAGVALWILDEPFAALDRRALVTVAELIDAHLARAGMVILTTHQDAGLATPARQVIALGA